MNIPISIILRKFKMNYISDNSFIIIIGNKGKSIITKDILYNKRHIPAGMVISNKKNIKNEYTYIPNIFIHNEYSSKNIRRFIKNQIDNVKKSDIDSRSFIVLDNIAYNDIKRNKYFRRLCDFNNKLNVLFIIEMYFLEVFNIEKSVDYIFILQENIIINKKNIYNKYFNNLNIQFSLYCKLMDDYTNDFNCLVLDVKSKSMNIQDKLYWYKADLYSDFKICCSESWDFSKSNLIDNNQNEDEDYIQKIYKRNLLF